MGASKTEELEDRTHFCRPEVGSQEGLASVMVLQLVRASGPDLMLRLPGDRYTLGRSAEADLTIDSDDISRRHILLKRENGTFSITDLESTNGVYLNGTRVHSAQLYHGDSLQLGDLVFRFREWGG